MELNESKMNKTQWHFHPKIHIFIVSCYANIHSSGLVKTKTLPDNLHYAACKQSDSRVDPNARSLDSERSERAPIDQSVCLRTRERLLWLATEWVNERISDSSECSELVFERTQWSALNHASYWMWHSKPTVISNMPLHWKIFIFCYVSPSMLSMFVYFPTGLTTIIPETFSNKRLDPTGLR